jgi:Tautomerase enzyme
MPWALIEVRRQWSREEETAIIDAVHAALVAAFRIPAKDKHVRLQVHEPHRFAHPPTLAEPEYATLVSVDCFAGRSVEAKRRLYGEIVNASNRWECLATMSRSPSPKALPKTGAFGVARLRVTSTSGSTSRSD